MSHTFSIVIALIEFRVRSPGGRVFVLEGAKSYWPGVSVTTETAAEQHAEIGQQSESR